MDIICTYREKRTSTWLSVSLRHDMAMGTAWLYAVHTALLSNESSNQNALKWLITAGEATCTYMIKSTARLKCIVATAIIRINTVTNFAVWEPPVKVFSTKFGHAPPTYMIDLAFRESFLREILNSYWFVKVFSLECFPLYGTVIISTVILQLVHTNRLQ